MPDLTDAEIKFLRDQGYSTDDVYDGRNRPASLRGDEAKELGKNFILRTPCEKAGHRLFSRSNHCVQCDTRQIAYQERFSSSGYVYIAGSLSRRLIKIGTAKDVDRRHKSLVAEAYGGTTDWELLFSIKVKEGGKLEQTALSGLTEFRTSRSYLKNGAEQAGNELLACSFVRALDEIVSAVQHRALDFSEQWMSRRVDLYDFEQLKKRK